MDSRSRSRPLPTTVTKVRKPTKHATLNLPRGKNHIHLGLLGEPMAQNLPFLVRVGEAKLEASNEHGQQLNDFHHGDVASDASAGAGAELEKSLASFPSVKKKKKVREIVLQSCYSASSP